MYSIIWTEPALSDYWQNIDYLLAEWSEKQAENFISETEFTLKILQETPLIFPATNYKSIRTVLVVKQMRLFYRVSPETQTIEIIRFWNTFQNPDALHL